MTSLPTYLFSYVLISLRTRLSIHLSPYALVSLLQKGDGKERWRGKMTRKENDFSPYALISLRTRLPTDLSPYTLNSLLSTQLESISGCGNYLCFVYLLKNEVIISQASLDGVEFERLVRRNRTCSSLM